MKRYRSVMLDSDAEMVEEAVAEEVILDETAAVDEEIVEEVMETVENTEE